MIVDQLKSLARHLRGQVPDRIVDLYEGDVNAGELQLAIEELFDALLEDEISISSDVAREIQALADELHVTRFSPDELTALVRG